MTPQEVIKKFMAELNANTYNYDTSGVGKSILDAAVRNSSKFTDTQAVITQMLADQTAAEKLAVEEVLGSAYKGQTLSQISSIWSAPASTYNSEYSSGITVQDAVKTRKAYIFLEKFCGIQLNSNFTVQNSTVYYANSDGTGNVDTGAITGSDANITLTAGDVVNNTTLTSANLQSLKTKYGSAASLSGDTIVIGSGVTKTEESVVPEDGDMYLFSAAGSAKNINTGTKGWVVNATSGNDTITSGGRDSINAGAGSDKIIANADESTITTGNGSDTVEISASVKSVTITDLNSSDTIKISGTFEVGNAQIENSMLVVTDKTGTRKIRFSDLTNVGNAKIGSQKISEWLSKSGYNISDIANGNISSSDVASGDISDDGGRVAIDPNYSPKINIANQDTVEETQTISSDTNINLDEVTITNGTVKSGSTTVGTVSTVVPAVMNFTTRGLTVHVGDGTSKSYNQLNASQKMMVAALFKWWAGESLKLNEESYKLGFTSDTANVTDITLNFVSISGDTLALVMSSYRGDHQTNQLELQINTNYYGSYTEGDKNGISSSENAGFLDRTLAHEFTHAVMSTNINNFSILPQFIKEGMAELTHGIDDERGGEIFELAYDASSLNTALNVNDTGTGNSASYSGGFMFLRYFARYAALQTLTDNIFPTDITATVNLGTGNATYYVSGNSTLETASTSTGSISIGSANGSTYTVGNTGVNQIINATGSGAKKIVGVTHNTSVKSGAGSDTIEFVEGTLIDAGDGNNSLGGGGQFATITTGTGNDSVVFKGSSNSINLGDGNNLLSIGGSPYTHDNSITTGKGDDTIYAASNNGTISTGDGNDTINFVYTDVKDNFIDLGAGNDSVNYVGSNNTIDMGAGDDYLQQSSGENYFLYNADSGNDTIIFFRSTDTLVIDGDYSVKKGTVFTNSSDGKQYLPVTVNLIKADSVVGSVYLRAASTDFDSLKNIVSAETAPEVENNPLLITLTANADTYNNTITGATILALGGADSINNAYYSSVSIDGGAGDDTISNNTGTDVTIDGGEGNDSISNGASRVSISGGAGDDSIFNSGSNVTIDGGAGDDSIFNSGSNVTIDGGDGNDSIVNNYSNVTIDGGDGNDSISNRASNVSIDAGAGDDTIFNGDSNVTIDAGDGNDYFWAENFKNGRLNMGDGADSVWSGSNFSNITVDMGAGDDSFVATGITSVTVDGGDGNDYINIFAYNSTLVSAFGGAGDDYIYADSANTTIDGGDGNDELLIAGRNGNAYAFGGAGNDSLYNTAYNGTLDGGADDDFIVNYNKSALLKGGSGNDFIQNEKEQPYDYIEKMVDTTIDAGDGNDTLYNGDYENISMSGGAGVDSIVNKGSDATINAGTGNDLISLDSSAENNLIEYATGDGSDTVYGFNSTSTLKIGDGTTETYSTTKSGSDILVKAGTGSVLLKNAATLESLNIDGTENNPLIKILFENADTYTNMTDKMTIRALGGNDTITNMSSLVYADLGDGNDYIYNEGMYVTISGGSGSDTIYTNSIYTSVSGGDDNDLISLTSHSNVPATINGGKGNDTIYSKSNSTDSRILFEYTAGDGNDTIYDFCKRDTLKIGDGTGTYSTQTSGSNILVKVGKGSVLLVGAANLSTVKIAGVKASINPLLIEGDDDNDSINNTLDSATILTYGGEDSIANEGANVYVDMGDGNDTIRNGVDGSPADGVNVTIVGGTGNDSITNRAASVTVDSGNGNDTIVNSGSEVSISTGDGNDTIYNGKYYKTTGDSVTINGGKGNDFIHLFDEGAQYNLIEYVEGDGNDSIRGFNATTTLQIGDGNSTYSIATSGKDLIVTVGEDSIRLENAATLETVNISGKNETPEEKNPLLITLTEKADTYRNTIDGATIQALGGDDTIENGYYASGEYISYASVSIDGGAGNDSIDNSGTEATIDGGAGDDYIYNRADNVTVSGGDGDDVIYSYGSNFSVDGGAGNDTISFGGISKNHLIEYTTGDGNDLILGFDKNSTLKIDGGTGTYSTTKSGNTLFVCVGKDTITLVGAAGLADNISDYILGNLIEYTPVTPATKLDILTENADNYRVSVEGATVQALAGDDTIVNTFVNVSIDAGAGNDGITNFSESVTVDGGDGDDYISNSKFDSIGSNFVVLNGGDGNDTIHNSNNHSVVINGGDGNDRLHNEGNSITISGGDGNDHIYNLGGRDVSINGGTGDDLIYNSANKVMFRYNAGDGNDTIFGFDATSTLSISEDNYSTEKSGKDVIVTVGDGSILLKNAASLSSVNIVTGEPVNPLLIEGTENADTVNNTLTGATIWGFGGNDRIINKGASVSIDAGNGNNTIYNQGDDVTITAGDGDDTIENRRYDSTLKQYTGADNASIDSGAGNDSIRNNGDSVTIDTGAGDDYLDNYGDNVSINGGDGDDTIDANDASSVTIDAGDGDDEVDADGDNVSINGGSGNDGLGVDGNNSTIIAGAGNDRVFNSGMSNVIDLVEGNNTVSNYFGANPTIFGGTGNDSISNALSGELGGIVYIYKGGDDTISGFGDADTLVLPQGSSWESVDSSEGDPLISVKDADGNTIGTILIDGITGKVNITDSTENIRPVNVIGNSEDNTLLIGVAHKDWVENYGSSVTVQTGDGNDTLRNGSDVVFLDDDGRNVGKGQDVYNVSMDGGAGNDLLHNTGSSATLLGNDGNDRLENVNLYDSGGFNVLMDGGDGNDHLTNRGGLSATLLGGDGDDDIQNMSNLREGYMEMRDVVIDGGSGDDRIYNYNGSNVSINGGTGNDMLSNENGENILFTYTDGDGKDTVWGFNATSTLKIGDGTESYSARTVNNDILVTVGDGSILLKNVASLESVNIYGVKETLESDLLIEGTDDAETIDNTLDDATIQALGGDDSIKNTGDGVLINAGAGNNKIYNTGHNVTIETDDGNNNISNGKIGDSVNAANILITTGDGNDSIDNSNSNVTINAGNGDNLITNIGVSVVINGGDDNDWVISGGELVTINGGAGVDTIYVEGKSITIDAGDGNDEIINAGENISIDAGDGDDLIETYNDDATITTGDGKDTIKLGEDVKSFEVTDFSAGDVISLNASVDSISVENDSLIAGNVTIAGIDSVSNEKFSWTIEDGTATYTKKTSGGAQLSDDGKKITFADEDSTETLFTLTGLSEDFTADDVSIDDGKIILSASALNQENISLTTDGNYSLKLGEDVPIVGKTDKSWTLDGTTATYHDTGKSEGYKLTNSKTVTYTAPVEGKELLTVTGLKDDLEVDDLTENLTVNGKVLTVTPDVVGDEFSISGGYKVVFDSGNYNGAKFTGTTGKDTIEVNGSNLSIDGGAGNDTITSKNSGNVYLFASTDGKDVVIGYGDNDTIKITDDSTVTASVKNKDVIIKAGNATMTLKNAATGTQVTVVDSDDNELINETFYADRIVKDNGATLTSAFNSKTFAADDTITAVDGSATSVKFSLTGGKDDNTLTGGRGNNFINGGGGENILTGGKGNDTFAAGNGVDTITDYETYDKISLTADVAEFSTNGKDVVLNFADDKSLTISDGVDKKITFLKNGKSSTEIFGEYGKTNANQTAITLNSSIESYTASTKMLTIDGGLTDDVFITGNAKNNKIFGGGGDDTIFGGKGNDTMTGGNGSDIFIYETGKDVITDYVSGKDTISLAASPTSETLTNKGDVVLKFGSGVLTIKNAAEQPITFADGTTKIYYSEKIIGNDGVTLQSTFKDTTFAATDDLPKVDASATTKKLTLTGGDEDNTLIGGKVANLIDGGKGDDLLIGGGGADTFVYSSGDDTIGDYGNASDKISLTSTLKDFDLSGDDVIIAFDDGSLTIADAAGKSVSFLETVGNKVKTNVNIFAAEGIYNSGKTALTLAADTSTFNAKNYSKVVSIDGGLTDNVSIVGNAKSNLIYAGDSGSTLNGGKGNDTLWGGDGSDTFIYESGGGRDVIYGFGDEDMLRFSGNFTASLKGNDISFKIGTQKDAITLKDYSASEFNINGNTYTVDTLPKK